MSDEQKQTCECPTGKALRKMMAVLPAINKDFWAIYDGEAKAALSAPCSCAEFAEYESRAEGMYAEVWAERNGLQALVNSLRAELQAARDEIAQHDLWQEEAYRQMAELRARVEALESALLECAIPLEVLCAANNPSLSSTMNTQIEKAVGLIRAAILGQPTQPHKTVASSAHVQVSPAGRLEVDGKRLFRRKAVQDDVAVLRAIPLDLEAERDSLRAKNEQLKRSLDWTTAEKHAAQADAEREKNVADSLRARVEVLEAENSDLRIAAIPSARHSDAAWERRCNALQARVEALEAALRDARCANIVLVFDLSREEGVRGEYMRIVERIDSALKPQPQEKGTPKT